MSAPIAIGLAVLAVLILAWAGNLALERRAFTRMARLGDALRGKMLRHAPSGTVGRMLGIGLAPHRWLRYYRHHTAVQLVVCPQCLAALKSAPDPVNLVSMILHAGAVGGIHHYPPGDLVAALPSEIRDFYQGDKAHE